MPVATELLEQIPAVARYVRVPLATDENAFEVWREAARLVDTAHFELIEGYVFDEPEAFPHGEDLQTLAAVFEANRQALHLFEEGIRRRGCQATELFELEDFENLWQVDRITELRNFAWLCKAKAKWHASRGEFDHAATVLVHQLRCGRMICRGDGTVLHFIIGSMHIGIALHAMQQISTLRTCPDSALAIMSDGIERELHEDSGYVQCERLELLNSLAFLNSFPDRDHPDVLIQHLLDQYYSPAAASDQDSEDAKAIAAKCAFWAKQRELDIRFLLDGHPLLLDKVATARHLGEQAVRLITRAEKPWSLDTDRSRDLFLPDHIWPHQLLPNMALEFIGDGDEATQSWVSYAEQHDYDPTSYGKYPSRERLTELRTQLRDVPNPIGWLLMGALAGSDHTDLAFQTSARLLAGQTCLAACRFRLKYKRTPKDLSELVEKRFLANLPSDPFDGKPLRYCRRRQLVWSIGRDGVDDGGHTSNNCGREISRDIVFSFKQPNRFLEWSARVWPRRK